jgi:hypothetical protein
MVVPIMPSNPINNPMKNPKAVVKILIINASEKYNILTLLIYHKNITT